MSADEVTVRGLQAEIVANRRRRGFPSATDLHKTTKGLREEIGEWEEALQAGDRERQLDALADIGVFVLGGFEILGADGLAETTKVVETNKTRAHSKVH